MPHNSPEDQLISLWSRAADSSKATGVPRGPGAPLIQFDRFLSLMERSGVKLNAMRGLDFGCGCTRPYSIASLLYLFGVSEVVAIDVAAYQDTEAPAIAKGLWLLLAVMSLGESGLEVHASYNRSTVLSRLADFDLDALRNGRLREGIPAAIQHRVGEYAQLAPEIGPIDVVVSNSVFEHVPDLQHTLAAFRTHLRNQGVIYSDIDYRDHRMYVNGLSPWEYLMDDSDVSPGYINKIRCSAMYQLLDHARLRVLASNPLVNPLPDEVRARLHARYQGLSERDLTVVQDSVLLG